MTDDLGSVRDLVDSDGNVANHLTYDAFGNVSSETAAAVDHIFGYTGRERDEESDLQYNRARYLDTAVGRWISEDPIGFAAGDANLSRYIENAPTMGTDPDGLKIRILRGADVTNEQFTAVRDILNRQIEAMAEMGGVIGDTSGRLTMEDRMRAIILLVFTACVTIPITAAKGDLSGPLKARAALSPNGQLVVRISTADSNSEGQRIHEVGYFRFDSTTNSYIRTSQFDLRGRLGQMLFVSDSGDLVLIEFNRKNSVRLYTNEGRLAKAWDIAEILSAAEVERCAETGSTLQWIEEGGFHDRTFVFRGPSQIIRGLHPPYSILRSADERFEFSGTIDSETAKLEMFGTVRIEGDERELPGEAGARKRDLPGEDDASNLVTNSIGMKLALIPAGEFLMGSPESETGRDDDELPHRVRITQPYYMQTTEVTQGQWRTVMGTEPWKGSIHVKEGPDYPVAFVSWEDAVEFCRKLSAREGVTYRLPTEAEWEYACRGGSHTAYSFGDDPSKLSEYAWHWENTGEVIEAYVHLVGQKRANSWGLYDMHGNVCEWCSDWYDDDYYESSPKSDPQGPSSGSKRAHRGGSWINDPQHCRSADRRGSAPDVRRDYLGFRVLRSSVE